MKQNYISKNLCLSRAFYALYLSVVFAWVIFNRPPNLPPNFPVWILQVCMIGAVGLALSVFVKLMRAYIHSQNGKIAQPESDFLDRQGNRTVFLVVGTLWALMVTGVYLPDAVLNSTLTFVELSFLLQVGLLWCAVVFGWMDYREQRLLKKKQSVILSVPAHIRPLAVAEPVNVPAGIPPTPEVQQINIHSH